MITNERQYRLTKSQAEKFQQAIREFDALAKISSGADSRIVHAQLGALESQALELLEAIKEYEELRSSGSLARTGEGLENLPILLIKSRIASGLTQKDLAERIGVKEQQIQRYEAEQYKTASLDRLTEIAAALGTQVRLEASAVAPADAIVQQQEKNRPIKSFPVRPTHGIKTET